MGVLNSFFGWPAGGVWANIIASVIWGAPAFVTHHVLMRRHQERVVTRETAAQTEQIKAHITTTLEGPKP